MNNGRRHRFLGNRAKKTSQILLVLFSAALVFCLSIEIVSAKVIDAETGGDCIDSDPVNCPFWAATGECQKNRGYMHKHCKKSCDRCNVVRVNDRSEITRYIEERKKEMEKRREEKRKEKEALKVLEGGSFGNAGVNEKKDQKELPRPEHENNLATATISSTGTVETATSDTNEEVDKIEKEMEVSTNKSDSASSTRQSSSLEAATSSSSAATTSAKEKPKKKKAKIDAQTGLECVDSHENCPFWAATGDCKTNRSFMSVNCRLSCDRCHVVRVQDANDIKKYIDRQKRASEGERRAKKEARQVQKILAGEL